MIRYALSCDKGHTFDSWFQSAAAFDKLMAGRLIGCTICGSTQVTKGLMAPAVAPSRAPAAPAPGALAAAHSPVEATLAALRRRIEENSDYVGTDFAAEARAIHDGDRPERAIYGEARSDEARKLLEDGIPVTPLPFLPLRKVN
jgi:hypothetical protein